MFKENCIKMSLNYLNKSCYISQIDNVKFYLFISINYFYISLKNF